MERSGVVVAVVTVGQVLVRVPAALVKMRVGVRLSGRRPGPVRVRMMKIVRVEMFVLHSLMLVLVPVLLPR